MKNLITPFRAATATLKQLKDFRLDSFQIGTKRETPIRAKSLSREDLFEFATNLAVSHNAHVSGKNSRKLYKRFNYNCSQLERAYKVFAESSQRNTPLTPGAEWLLDNYHVVQKQITDIRRHFPHSYDRTLPKLNDGTYALYPRVYHIALQYLRHSDSVVAPDLLSTFIDGYQQKTDLTIGELWAIPIMLRFALIENLSSIASRLVLSKTKRDEAEEFVDSIMGDESRLGTEILFHLLTRLNGQPEFIHNGAPYLIRRLRERGRKAAITLQWLEERFREEGVEVEELLRSEKYFLAADQISIGHTFNSLRDVSIVDWKSWFQSVSTVHKVLLSDPAKSFAKCDFKTQDRYRHKIEQLSLRTKVSEKEIAQECIALATEERARLGALKDCSELLLEKRAHVGYYLLDAGIQLLEQRVRCAPTLFATVVRHLLDNRFAYYLGAISVLAVAIVVGAVNHAALAHLGVHYVLVVAALVLLPAIDLANNFVQWGISKILQPDFLPKLDFSRGISKENKTAVVVQTLFTSKEAAKRAVDSLEVCYLANPEENLVYGLLSDLADADTEGMPTDDEIISHTHKAISDLNARYGEKRFFVLFRKRLWNKAQGKFMGWERKRGKIEEFNNLILGNGCGSFLIDPADVEHFRDIRFVVTLDADSQLPRGIVLQLVGAIAHPLNRAIFDSSRQRVGEGYSIIQPRVVVSLTSAQASPFAKIFAGHAGLDPYTQTVSEVYQDLFHDGSYIGKGIYDVAAFHTALAKRVPENALLSHDLFEGLFARTALATDIELFDDFPAQYHVHAKRQHRWARGDWQLLPWLFSKVPDRDRKLYPSPLSPLSRWKIVDNLRRSLVFPSLFFLLCFCWMMNADQAADWTLFALVTLGFPVFANLAGAFIVSTQGISITNHVRGIGKDLLLSTKQTLFAFCLLPHQTYLMIHAMTVTLCRLLLTRRMMLEWETAQSAEQRLGRGFGSSLREISPALLLVTGSFVVVWWLNPSVFTATAPIFLIWISSPYIASILGRPVAKSATTIGEDDKEYLSSIGWKTWRYFRDFMHEDNNFLVPDNLQMIPNRVVAARTSPTNISVSILSTISAHDLGFIALPSVLERLEKTFKTLDKLEKYHGHLLNWYDTRTLMPLAPRYVSFVDSGNLIAHLIAANEAFNELPDALLVNTNNKKQLKRIIVEVTEIVPHLKKALSEVSLPHELATLSDVAEFLDVFEFVETVLQTEIDSFSADEKLRSVLVSALRDLQDLSSIKVFFGWVSPFLEFSQMLAEANIPEIARGSKIPELTGLSLRQLKRYVQTIASTVERTSAQVDNKELLEKLSELLSSAQYAIDSAFDSLKILRNYCEQLISEMDFRFLYDDQRDLFVIGYNLDNARRDSSYYDLLASEARLGSLVAIALGQIPQKHWFLLGRSITEAPGGRMLLSWSGTMFEFLMPLLVTKDFPDTILSHTCRAAVRSQQLYGKKRGVPWGISESAFSGIDFEKTYQYHAFGVPGLGIKRGLEDDLVISPYSTFMALPIDSKGCISNLRQLEREDARGEYGFFEAIDYTPLRLSENEEKHVVQSFFAHHHGMSLVSINNLLNDGVFQNRFHTSPIIKATELLLQEKFPERLPVLQVQTSHIVPIEQAEREQSANFNLVLNTPHTSVPRTHLLSNGHYSVMIDNAGSGFSSLSNGISLTRWREDAVSNALGSYVYIRDLESGSLWSAAYQPTCVEPETYEVVFSPDKAEFKRRDFDIFTQMEVTVSPEENVEVRRLSFTNLSSERRILEITSYCEVVLGDPRGDAAHPSFSKMFVESEFLEERHALLFSRRQRTDLDKRLHFFHMASMKTQWARVDCETSRFEFIGRGNSIQNPKSLHPNEHLSNSIGHVLDPIGALRTHIEIESGATESINLIFGAAEGRESAQAYVSRYCEPHQISRAFEMAWSQSSVELRNERVAARQNQLYQRLGNALLFNIEQFRAAPEVLARNKLAQSGLWRFGISGDIPICLVHITDPVQTKLVQEVLLAHNYLRLRGFTFDLVILNEYPGGYLQALQEDLEYLARSSASGGLIDKKGGLFLRTMIQLSEDEKDLLFTVARVVLIGERGKLSSQIKFKEILSSPLYRKPAQSRGKIQLSDSKPVDADNGIGGFVDNGSGYQLQIRDSLPPLPWCNVLANPNFGTLITESGTAYTWADNCRENRITPWSNDPVSDPSPEVIYIRDSNRGIIWCPTPRPVESKAEYLVEHSFGQSTFKSEIEGIKTTLEISIAETERVKWWKLHLENHDSVVRKLELYLYVDWALGPSREEHFRYIQTGFDSTSNCIFAQNLYNPDFAGRISFIGSSCDIEGYTASKAEFIGRNHSPKLPLYLAAQGIAKSLGRLATHDPFPLSRKTGTGFDPCGVIKVTVDLEPGKNEDVLFFLGQAHSEADLRRIAPLYASLHVQKSETKKYKQAISDTLSTVTVTTPEKNFDILINGWLLYQVMNSRLYGRTGFYQSGGAFGFRDQLQDVLALLWAKPEAARAQILLHASRQFVEGDVQHWWHPPSGKGVRTKISDDFLWLPLVTARYIETTGDVAIIDETASYIEGPILSEHEHELYIVPQGSQQSGSVYEHCIKAIERALHFGKHGLPLMGAGDWNDGMNEVGKDGRGESVWMGWFLITVIQEFLPIIRERGDTALIERYQQIVSTIRQSIEAHAWDGKWYRRAYFDDGTPLGSSQNTECQIDAISQSWGVISRVLEPTAGNIDRLTTAMGQVYERLVDEEIGIIKLLAPPFDKSLPFPGYIQGYAPGIRENGGQYTHSAAWVIIATALMGNGDKALQLMNLINPINHTNSGEGVAKYQGEPYVFCGDVYAVSPHQGRAGWSWYTGSASWIYQAGLHYIVGLQLKRGVLSFSPCVASSWRNFSVQMRWNETNVQIEFFNPQGVQRGVTSVTVNSEVIPEKQVDLSIYAGLPEISVVVQMG